MPCSSNTKPSVDPGKTVWNDDAALAFARSFGPEPGSPRARIDDFIGSIEHLTVAEALAELGQPKRTVKAFEPIADLTVSTVLARLCELIAFSVADELEDRR